MKKARYGSMTEFSRTLNAEIDHYFQQTGKSRFGDSRMIFKTIVVTLLFIALYFILLLGTFSLPVTVGVAFLFAQVLVMVGFSIMHDSNHGSYSSNATVNRVLGFSLECIGGSSLLWSQKHNFLHHSYTNINGLDDDIQTAGFIRLSPQQKWRRGFRFQAFYAPVLYGVMTFHWFWFNDFVQFFTKKIGEYRVRGIGTKETIIFLFAKMFCLSYMILIPSMFHNWQSVLAIFLFVHVVVGITISVVFQLAHTLDSNEFPEPDAKGNLVDEFLVHQLKTTSNFSRKNPILTWYLGGLNYQIEHHLFPKICHIHYPQISPIVEKVCLEFDVPYKNRSSFWGAIVNHFRFLNRMGNSKT